MKRDSITKPKFWKIFTVRLIAWCLLTSLAAAVTCYVSDFIFKYKRQAVRDYEHQNVVDSAESLSLAEPGTKDYEDRLSVLKISLALYQLSDNNYAEVYAGDKLIASTAEDTVYISYQSEEGSEFFFVKDMSCFDALTGFMDGKYDPKKYNDMEVKYAWDPVASDYMSKKYLQVNYGIRSAYLDLEKHTFIPETVIIQDRDNTYEVNCNPKNTDGYKHIDLKNGKFFVVFSYRKAPQLSSGDVNQYAAPAPSAKRPAFTSLSSEMYEELLKAREITWHVGFAEPENDEPFHKYAPYTCMTIWISALLAAAVISLVFSFVKYQKDKTVWKIFDYRTKTTEAMAHDLKTPMAAIAAYAESLEDFAGDPEKTGEYSAKISAKVKEMDHMIEDILALSKTGTAKVEINKEDVSVTELVKESLQAFPDMETEIRGDDVTLKTDRKLLKQSVDNLLSNCSRYGEKGSPVVIVISSGELSISNKTSMTYSDVESLKKPFVKGDGSRNDKGTGLGLSIAENNLNILGYRLVLSSKDGQFKAQVKYKI